MNPVRALLWKEGREAVYKVAGGSCVALLLGLAYLHPVFNREYPLEAVSFLVGLLASVLMGIDQVSGERSRGTLPFLLSRPLAPARLLGVKFAVGAAGVLVVLASFWAGVYLGLPEWGKPNFLWWFYQGSSQDFFLNRGLQEILQDVGFARILLLWFLPFLILYTPVFLSSAFSDRPLKAVAIALMSGWIALFCLGSVSQLSPAVSYSFQRILFNDLTDKILRLAFDPSLLLVRFGTAALIAGGVLLWSTLALRAEASRRFQWGVTTLALISAAIVLAMDATQPHRTDAPVEPVGRLPYEAQVADLDLNDRSAVVLLENGVSVVDVADWRVPKETGRAEIDGWRLWRLALSGTTVYAWGSAKDSVGVAVFDLSLPERPQLQVQRLLHPIEPGPTPWLKGTPLLTGWAVRDGYLYAGLLGSELLELHSFDVREGGLPQPVHVLPVEERIRHAWSYDGELQFVGSYAFLTLGHDFVVLDLTDPGRPAELSRTPLRRFGRSKQYEESIEQLHHQLSPGVLPESVVQKLEEAGHNLETLEMREWTPEGEHDFFRIARPLGLGPISVDGNRAYVQRHRPQELAVLDISDPRHPVEIEYILGRFPRLTIDGDFAFGRAWDEIWSYAMTRYGAQQRRERLGFQEPANLPNVIRSHSFVGPGQMRMTFGAHLFPYNYRGRHSLILAGDHICAVMKNHLVIFETPQND